MAIRLEISEVVSRYRVGRIKCLGFWLAQASSLAEMARN